MVEAVQAQAVSDLKSIIKRAKRRGLKDAEIVARLEEKSHSSGPKPEEEDFDPWKKSCYCVNLLLFKIYPIFFVLLLPVYPAWKMMSGSACLLTEISPFGEAVTPIVDCAMCEDVFEAPRLVNLSQDDFIRNYAYTSKPILVEGAVSHWSALKVFSYDYFKSIYMESLDSLEEDDNSGQFFAYSSNIMSLKDLFALPSDVATMKTEKWYIGWYVLHGRANALYGLSGGPSVG
jgi:hypothetical protein